jgi:hypothetical protein
MSDINYKVYYINLDNRQDRQYSILQQLRNVNIPLNKIHRINAVQHKLGAFGCLLSHIKTLKRALKDGVDYAVIVEDDFIFNKKIKFKSLLKYLNNFKWDVCLLDGKNYTLNHIIYNLYNVQNSVLTSGYIINKDYIYILLRYWLSTVKLNNINLNNNLNCADCSRQFGCPYTKPLDISWRILQKKHKWIMVYPKIGKQLTNCYSNIQKRIRV